MLRTTIGSIAVLAVLAGGAAAGTADFDDLSLGADSYWNGGPAPGNHTFASGGATFNNFFDDTYGPYWCGWAYSNQSDTTTPGYLNQYSAITGAAHSGSNYAVGYMDTWYGITSTLVFPAPVGLDSAWFTNTTYPYLIMRDGDPNMMAKQFGGPTGNDPDWFLLTITGKDAAGQTTGTVNFYLADYRFADHAQDYLVNQWTQVDLSPLGAVKSVEFTLDSSDSSPWGLNTPAYFAMDTLTTVPEPATLGLAAAGLALAAGRRRRP
jgi:hypothetical protein